jgi:peptide/nickel transport system substrate-binding protein
MHKAQGSRHKAQGKRKSPWALGLVLWALCLALVVSACATEEPVPSGIIVVGVRQAPNNLDPRFATDEASQRVNQLVFNSLMDFDEQLRVRPTLAERLDNPDPLTYIATLRRGVKFHDGRELTSKDVVFNYQGYIDPASTSPFKGAFRTLQSVRAIDDYTVEFKLKEPFAAFPVQLVSPPIIPAGAGDDFGRRLIGTGAYRFIRYDVDDKVILAPFAGHFAGAPKNAGLIIRVIPDDTMRGLEVRKRSVDVVVNDMPPDIVYQLKQDGRVTLAEAPGLDYMYVSCNTQDPILKDRRVRQALAYAIDRDAIVKYLRRGLAREATSIVPPQAWAFEPGVKRYTYDPAYAMQLLAEAGYRDPDGSGPAARFRLTLKLGTADEFRQQAAVIQQQFRAIGVDLDVQSLEFATMFADVVKGNFQLVQMQWAGGALVDPDIIRRVFHSQQVPPAGFNRGRYNNPEVDRLIDLATTAFEESERKRYYGEAQKIIANDSPYISLWNRTNVAIGQPALQGLHINVTGNFESLRDVTKGDR